MWWTTICRILVDSDLQIIRCAAFRTDIIVLLPFLKKNNAKIVYILKEYLQNWQLKLIRQKRLIYMNRFLYIVKNKDFRSSRKRKDTL